MSVVYIISAMSNISYLKKIYQSLTIIIFTTDSQSSDGQSKIHLPFPTLDPILISRYKIQNIGKTNWALYLLCSEQCWLILNSYIIHMMISVFRVSWS